MNITLTPKLRRILQISVVVLLITFVVGWFMLFKPIDQQSGLKNDTVYIQDSTLYAFDDEYSLNFPNRISVHYPYLLVIEPNEQKTTIYNLPERKIEKKLDEAILDYWDSRIIKNDGRSTYLDGKDLGILCDKGLIKNQSEVYCITKINTNFVENKVISIQIADLKQKELYKSSNILTNLSLINDNLYIGEIDLQNKNNYLIINDQKVDVPSVVSLIYEMDGKPYFATTKTALSENEAYYLINSNQVTAVEQKPIRLYSGKN